MDTRTYNINLRNDYFNPVAVGLSQYDEGVTLAFNVYDGTDPADFAAGTTAQIMGVRPSGVGFDVSCTLTDNVATVSTITDMTGEAGIFPVEIRFYNSGVNVGTCNFIFAIEKAAHPDGTIDADITHEQDIVDKITQILIQTTPDTTLSEAGVAADSKAVGDNIRRIDGQIGNLGTRITNVEDDISYQSLRIDRTNKIKAPVIWEEASGNPAVFDDGADGMYLKNLTLTLTPSQDLNGYDYAWAGGNGKNKFDYNGVGSLDSLSNNNGTFTNTNTDTRTGFGLTVQQYNGTNYIKSNALTISESGRYSIPITIDTEITKLRIKHNGAKKDFIINYPFTEQGTYCLSLTVISANPTVAGGLVFKDIMLEIGSTATEYEPYSNICPISGAESVTVKRTGKNLLGGLITTTATQGGVTFTANSDGTYTANGTNNSGGILDYRLNGTGQYQLELPTGDYYFNGGVNGLNGSGNTLYLRISDGTNNRYVGTNNTGSGTPFTIGEGEYISSQVFIRIADGVTANNAVFYPMIRPASISDATYEPYDGVDYDVEFGQTIYGGTVNPILWDLQGGDIVFDRKVFSVGDLAWSKQSGNIFKATPDNVTGSASYDLSDTFRRNPVADSAMENGDYKLTVAGTLYVKMEGFGTAAGFKAAYADAKFCAKLAHSEIGAMYPEDRREITTAYLDNVITAQPDKGNVTNIKATYPADTKAYIDKAIAAAGL